MGDFIEIHWTSGSLDEARRISRYLVQEKLVACAQIIPWIESIFLWKANLETSQESKVVFKAPASNFEKVKEVILQNCTYEVPEVTQFAIVDGNQAYLDWMAESTSK